MEGLLDPHNRFVVEYNITNGYWEVYDTLTGKVVGNAQTEQAARIIRRKKTERHCYEVK